MAKSTDFLSLAIEAFAANIHRKEARHFMWQTAFSLNQAVKRLEAHFAPAIMAEKRQELSQRTKDIVGEFSKQDRGEI